MAHTDTLQATVDALVQPGKGILAADESGPTIAKRFKSIGVESTEATRRAYRGLLLSTPGLGKYISGVILYEETLLQSADDGTPLPRLAAQQGIVPGIKVDAGKIALANAPGDEITQGLDGLAKRRGGHGRPRCESRGETPCEQHQETTMMMCHGVHLLSGAWTTDCCRGGPPRRQNTSGSTVSW